jgi:hypothetical protein
VVVLVDVVPLDVVLLDVVPVVVVAFGDAAA